MKVRKSMVAAGVVVALGTTGAIALPAVASAHSTSHTLRFTAERVNKISFTKKIRGSEGKDVNKAGETIGFNVVHTTVGKTSVMASAAFDFRGGLLYGTLTGTNGTTYSGQVTGGTGKFTGATGTIKAKEISTGTAITITYATSS